MRYTPEEKLEAYQLALHQMVNALSDIQAWVKLARQGQADLMHPTVLDSIEHTVFGRAKEAMDPLEYYRQRKGRQELITPSMPPRRPSECTAALDDEEESDG